MKQLNIKRISIDSNIDCSQLSAIFDRNNIEWNTIDVTNWEQNFPYCPVVRFRIAHNDNNILLNFHVEENDVRAVCDKDNDRSWEDSCVEFFLQPQPPEPLYYNFEFTCVGFKLIGGGDFGTDRGRASQEQHARVKTWSSLGANAFGQKHGATTWQLSAIIPLNALYLSDIKHLSGRTMKGNFYKCGDLTPNPHFVSWTEIEAEKPQFHLPKFFGCLNFL